MMSAPAGASGPMFTPISAVSAISREAMTKSIAPGRRRPTTGPWNIWSIAREGTDMAVGCDVPLVIRGRVIDTPTAAFGGRGDGMVFHACDVAEHLDELALSAPSAMADLYTLSFDDILDFLHRLGERLQLADNAYLQEAFRVSCLTSGLSESILRHHYKEIPFYFHRDVVSGMAEGLVGIDFLEGWVERPSGSPGVSVAVRAFGARCVHVIAGNVPAIGVMTIVRNAFTRSDAIIKSPSNDPLTALAVARTM